MANKISNKDLATYLADYANQEIEEFNIDITGILEQGLEAFELAEGIEIFN